MTTDIVHCELGATDSYHRRYCLFIPGRGGRDDQRLGTLRIRLFKERGGESVDQYGVEEWKDEAVADYRRFILRNDDPPEDGAREEFYLITCGPKGSGCSCPANTRRQVPLATDCKHKSAILKLLEVGAL